MPEALYVNAFMGLLFWGRVRQLPMKILPGSNRMIQEGRTGVSVLTVNRRKPSWKVTLKPCKVFTHKQLPHTLRWLHSQVIPKLLCGKQTKQTKKNKHQPKNPYRILYFNLQV